MRRDNQDGFLWNVASDRRAARIVQSTPHPSPSFVRTDQEGGRWLGFGLCERGFEVIIRTYGKLVPARTVATLLGRSGQATEWQVLAETGTAGLECATATRRRSFMGIANGSRRL